jgi:catechol 2,3-dioxygenase-like lactoylglutathione lyase family enzyme
VVKALAHVQITSPDLKATERFYCDALGLKKKFSFFKGPKEVGFYLELGRNTFLEFFEGKLGEKVQHPAISHFCIEVSSIDEVERALQAKGISITGKVMGGDNAMQAWIVDPSGVRVELHEYNSKSMQLVGGRIEAT